MNAHTSTTVPLNNPTLTFAGFRALYFQILFIAAAVLLPAAAHMSGISVRLLLPMHWPVLLAGLVYGWRAGLLTGLLAPAVNYLLTGFPLPPILPSMTVELLTYGLVTGLLREVFRINPFIAVTVAAIAGRIVFVISVVAGNVVTADQAAYFQAALMPGVVAAIVQVAALPFVAQWWIAKERKPDSE
jgi:niacin transporter